MRLPCGPCGAAAPPFEPRGRTRFSPLLGIGKFTSVRPILRAASSLLSTTTGDGVSECKLLPHLFCAMHRQGDRSQQHACCYIQAAYRLTLLRVLRDLAQLRRKRGGLRATGYVGGRDEV